MICHLTDCPSGVCTMVLDESTMAPDLSRISPSIWKSRSRLAVFLIVPSKVIEPYWSISQLSVVRS